MSKPSVIFCQSCLATDRRLVPLLYLQEPLNDLNLTADLADSDGSVCWECNSVLIKFYKFKRKVAYAQQLLGLSKNTKPNLRSLSTLNCETKNTFDAEYTEHAPSDAEQIKQELRSTQSDCENEGTDWQNDPEQTDSGNVQATFTIKIEMAPSDICEDDPPKKPVRKRARPSATKDKGKAVKTKKAKQEKAKIIKLELVSEVDDGNVKEKYEKIEFTQEQMIRNREEKRGGHNYKKLPFKCNTCVLGFTRKETYDQHMERKHDTSIGEDACAVCAIRFPNENSASRHQKKHYILYKCKLCKYENQNLNSIESHCKVKHKGDALDRIRCQACDAVCKSPEEMADHVMTQHPLQCNECGETFKSNNSLRSHKRRYHTTRRDFACDTCGRRYPSQSRLESHVASHGGAQARKLAYCTLCRIQYKDIYVLRNHQVNSPAHSVNTFECAVCSKKFSAKVYLRRHMNFFHLKKSKHKCDECQKQFMSSWSLRNHRQLHHGEARDRNYRCELCGGLFFTLATLKNHKLTHSEERKFMCSECGDTFKQQASLYTHCKMLHKGKNNKT